MQRITILIVLAALCTSGCRPGYRVHVNGYAELTDPIASNAVMYVTTDPNAANPIFERQVKASAEALLHSYGYRLAETPEQAEYRLDFQLGARSENVTGYTPVYSPYFGARGGYPGNTLFGFTNYAPYTDTFYDQWLILRLARPSPGGSEADALVWVGEAVMSADKADLRETIDYLLVGCIEFLGVDTGRKATLTIRKDDPRIRNLAKE